MAWVFQFGFFGMNAALAVIDVQKGEALGAAVSAFLAGGCLIGGIYHLILKGLGH